MIPLTQQRLYNKRNLNNIQDGVPILLYSKKLAFGLVNKKLHRKPMRVILTLQTLYINNYYRANEFILMPSFLTYLHGNAGLRKCTLGPRLPAYSI